MDLGQSALKHLGKICQVFCYDWNLIWLHKKWLKNLA